MNNNCKIESNKKFLSLENILSGPVNVGLSRLLGLVLHLLKGDAQIFQDMLVIMLKTFPIFLNFTQAIGHINQ